jgi:hypothetical protein
MVAYPSTLVPDRIAFDLGIQNASEESTFAGPVRFRHSMQTNGYSLQLTYENLRQSEVDTLRAHYFQSQGVHGYFVVPSAVWGASNPVSPDSLYRYSEPPAEEHFGVYFNVTVSLRIIAGINFLYILEGGGATLPATAPFTSYILTGNAPFTLEAGGENPTLAFDCRGASQ